MVACENPYMNPYIWIKINDLFWTVFKTFPNRDLYQRSIGQFWKKSIKTSFSMLMDQC